MEIATDIAAFAEQDKGHTFALPWPVDDHVFSACERADGLARQILLADLVFFDQLVQYLHYWRVQCEARGHFEIRSTHLSAHLLMPNWTLISNE